MHGLSMSLIYNIGGKRFENFDNLTFPSLKAENQIATKQVNAMTLYSLKASPCFLVRPPATSVNCVSRLEGYRERLVLAKVARLVLICRGI